MPIRAGTVLPAMAALRTIHLCPYGFQTIDIVVVNSETDGGTSLNGLSDVIYSDGGGYWQGTWSSGTFGGRSDDRRDKSLSWRAIQAGLAGGASVIALFCDLHHQPVYGLKTVPHDDGTDFDDGSEYASPGAESTVLAVYGSQPGGLNSTSIDIAIASERQLRGGEKFSYIGANGWGKRAAEIISVEPIDGGFHITFQPPVRGGIAIGDALDFVNVGCMMRRASQPSNALNPFALTTSIQSLVLVEDMRVPSA